MVLSRPQPGVVHYRVCGPLTTAQQLNFHSNVRADQNTRNPPVLFFYIHTDPCTYDVSVYLILSGSMCDKSSLITFTTWLKSIRDPFDFSRRVLYRTVTQRTTRNSYNGRKNSIPGDVSLQTVFTLTAVATE